MKDSLSNCVCCFVQSSRVLYEDGAGYPDVVEISSKQHAVEAVEVHYQLHSIALKSLLCGHAPFWREENLDEATKRHRREVESAVAEALVELKEFPLCRKSYPSLWVWTKQLCSEAFAKSSTAQCTGEPGPAGGDGGLQRPALAFVSPRQTEEGSPLVSRPQECPPHISRPKEQIARPEECSLESDKSEERPKDLLDIASEHRVVSKSEEDMDVDVVGGASPPLPPPDPTHGGGVAAKPSSYQSLVQLCIYGVAVCAVRYPVFFKPLYRLAYTLHTIGLPQVRYSLLVTSSLAILLCPYSKPSSYFWDHSHLLSQPVRKSYSHSLFSH